MGTRKRLVGWCALWIVVILSLGGSGYSAGNLDPGARLTPFMLAKPDSEAIQKYLDLKDAKPFSLSELSAKLIVVEFYSIYCPICQRQAPRANKLFNFIEEDPQLRKDIKMIGIGLGNTDKEIDVYRQTHRVRFPLFSDPGKEIAAKSGVEEIPLTVLVDNSGKILLSHLGVVDDLDGFFRQIRQYHRKAIGK